MAAPIRKHKIECPVYITLSVLRGKWKPLIIYELLKRPYRFNELRRALPGISQRLLSVELKELEAEDVLVRRVLDSIPPQVKYSLTDKGLSLSPILKSMEEWGISEKERKV